MDFFRAFFLATALSFLATAHAAPVRGPHIEVELVAGAKPLTPGDNPLALRLKPDPGWHTYWRNPGDSGLPTQVKWDLPSGWTAGELQWPYPEILQLGGIINYGYEGEVLLPVTVTAPAGASGRVTLRAHASWLVCSDERCVPGKADLQLTRLVAPVSTQSQWAGALAETRVRLPQPSGLHAEFHIADGQARLDIHGDELLGLEGLRFFPYANDLLDHGKPQQTRLNGGRAQIRQALNVAFSQSPQTLDGVLVIESDPVRAYEIRAVPADVSAPGLADAESGTSVATALLFALLGGLILNLMPCVFPVLSLKALSLAQTAGGDARLRRRHALAYSAGVVLSCLAVAAVLLTLRAAGERIGWGFQLQSPVFVAGLIYLLFVLGLSLSGFWQIGAGWMGTGQSLAMREDLAGSFFTGVLATVVASPCTAPFMGVALGYALTQSAPVSLLVFATLGLGLALPFLLIGHFPALARALPRPGAWMERFKQVMAFPLYLSAVWLLWVLTRQAGADAAALVLCGLVLLGFAIWAANAGGRVLAIAATLTAFAALAHPALRPNADDRPRVIAEAGIEPYSDARLDELRAQGRPVFVNFTADWCLTCKANERIAIGRDEVQDAFRTAGVTQLVGDWTNSDPAITAALARHGRAGVPLYLWITAGQEPEVLPQILTPDLLLSRIRQLHL